MHRRSLCNVKVLWEDESTTWEPIKNIPIEFLCLHAQEHDLLNKRGWKSVATFLDTHNKLSPDCMALMACKHSRPIEGSVAEDNICAKAFTAIADEIAIDAPGADPGPFLQLP